MHTSYLNYDLIIIGAGGAGITSAIEAAENGLKVIVISKVHPLHSHTAAAQGGINASLGEIDQDDWRWHMYDTIKGSDWLGDQDAIELLCKKAPDAIHLLEKYGVNFDRNNSGQIQQKVYGGQTTEFGKGNLAKRVCSVADNTGNAIMQALYDKSIDANVTYLNYHYAIELIIDDALSVITLNLENGKFSVISAPNVILATGGYSQIYKTSTSSNICSGDGNGLIWKANLPLQDMEFVQFHPTAIYEVNTLITEASRAAGGKLINNLGERFMSRYAPDRMELACRDIVARAISQEIAEGRGCGEKQDYVLLDLRDIPQDFFATHLPNVLENCQQFLKIDPTQTPIPIVPAAHYTMGGIPTNIDCQVIDITDNFQESIIEGLYAIGEAACVSVHGANRLGCNSLLDIIVFGKIAATHIIKTQKKAIPDQQKLARQFNEFYTKFSNIFVQKSKSYSVSNIKNDLKNIMNKYAGVFRNKALLEIGMESIQNLRHQFAYITISDSDLKWNHELIEYLECDNLLISAEATIKSALLREESRGAHYREDFPARNDSEFLHHSIIKKHHNNILHFKRAVRMTPQTVDFFPPESRNY